MACFKPIQAYRLHNGEIVFHDKGNANPMELPCGQCIGCRLQRSKEWALRCMHEASCNEQNSFITLTYNAENIPPDGGLVKSHVQKFFKRLRKSIYPKKVKYYYCAEYGEKNNRPHYHILLFGYCPSDWILLPFPTKSGQDCYTSPSIEKLWGKGFVQVGEVTFESAAYVSRYIMKKVNGQAKDIINPETGLKHYERYNDFTGEIHEVLPEYADMSRGGRYGTGIGGQWFNRYSGDCYPKDYITFNGTRHRPPRYYDDKLKKENPEMYDELKAWRAKKGYESGDNMPHRLKARQKVTEAKTSRLKRSL
jgi:hypothetical protein